MIYPSTVTCLKTASALTFHLVEYIPLYPFHHSVSSFQSTIPVQGCRLHCTIWGVAELHNCTHKNVCGNTPVASFQSFLGLARVCNQGPEAYNLLLLEGPSERGGPGVTSFMPR